MTEVNNLSRKDTTELCSQPKWKRLLVELRAPFFTASIVPVLLGASLAFHETGTLNWPLFFCTLFGLMLIHAGANTANDYFDHLSGNDEINKDFVRPFTGGSRMIQKGLLTPRDVLVLSLSCFALGSVVGLYLTWKTGMPILVLGLIGVAGGFFYTAPPVNLAAKGIGELVIGLNFGVLPVLGTYYVQTARFSLNAFIISLPAAILIAAVLFLNQFQDHDADRDVGKRNWVVRLGRRKSVPVYAVLMLAWVVPVLTAVFTNRAPALLLISLIPLILAVKAITIARRNFNAPRELSPANGITIACHLAVGIFMSISLLITRSLQ